MEYSQIFKKDVIAKILNQINEPTTRTSQSELIGRAQKALPLIQQIEKEYIPSLEDLALQIVYEVYPALKDMEVEVDAKISNEVQKLEPSSIEQLLASGDDLPTAAIKKRRILNSLMQGSAQAGSKIYHLIKDELNILDERLIDVYDTLLNSTYGLYDYVNFMSRMNFQSMSNAVGHVKVEILENNKNRFKITARGSTFPFLIHEIIKGYYQILSMHGWSDLSVDADSRDKVQAITDTPEHEIDDIKFGKYIYAAINDILAKYTSSTPDPRLREHFLVELYGIEPVAKFIRYIENAIREDLDAEQIQWTKNIIHDIESDMKHDDANDALSEIKILLPSEDTSIEDLLTKFKMSDNNIIRHIHAKKEPNITLEDFHSNDKRLKFAIGHLFYTLKDETKLSKVTNQQLDLIKSLGCKLINIKIFYMIQKGNYWLASIVKNTIVEFSHKDRIFYIVKWSTRSHGSGQAYFIGTKKFKFTEVLQNLKAGTNVIEDYI